MQCRLALKCSCREHLAARIIWDADKSPRLASSGSLSGGERRRFGETGYRFRWMCAVGISEIEHSASPRIRRKCIRSISPALFRD